MFPRPGNVNHVGDGVIVGTQDGSPGWHWQCLLDSASSPEQFQDHGFLMFSTWFHIVPYVSLDVLLIE